jgi:hypothetical protein
MPHGPPSPGVRGSKALRGPPDSGFRRNDGLLLLGKEKKIASGNKEVRGRK